MYTEEKDKVAAILSYITWLGWVVAFITRNKDDELSRLHLNQGFVLAVASLADTLLNKLGGVFEIIGDVVDIAVLVLSIMGIARAAKASDEPLPIIGDIQPF